MANTKVISVEVPEDFFSAMEQSANGQRFRMFLTRDPFEGYKAEDVAPIKTFSSSNTQEPLRLYVTTEHELLMPLNEDITIKLEYALFEGEYTQWHDKLIQDIVLYVEAENPSLEQAIGGLSDIMYNMGIMKFKITITRKLPHGGQYIITALDNA